MKIKYIAWKKVINSDVNRLIYATQGKGLHNKGDQAIQNFNTLNKNPGLWEGFTGGEIIPRKKEIEYQNRINNTHLPTTYDVVLDNSVNALRLWEDKNDSRHNPVKINHEIWDRNAGHEKAIIEPWYLGYMRLLRKLLVRLIERDGEKSSDAKKLLNFVEKRLSLEADIRANILKWIYDTQDGFAALYLDTSFMANSNLRSINGFIENSFYLVVKCEDNGVIKNMALMADASSTGLHPKIRSLLKSNERGGEYVDIEVSIASSSPDAQRFLDALYKYKNIILYGPPGTGKTHMLSELMNSFNASVLFDDLDTEAPFRVTGAVGESTVKWCTFHPNYSYESFVTGITPKIIKGNIAFQPHIGPMLSQSLAAEKGIKSLLVIDEINRAKTDDVFGATMAILDRGSKEFVRFAQPFKVGEELIEGISASDNMFIVGTMNSLDKATTPISGELKRRFITIEISPNVEVLRLHLQRNKTIEENLVTFCCDLMKCLNDKIHIYCGKEYELGQGYFWPLVDSEDNHQEVVADIIINKVYPHIKDILSQDNLVDFFGANNAGILYETNNSGYDFSDLSGLTNEEIVNAFALSIGSDYRCKIKSIDDIEISFEKYNQNRINYVLDRLLRYKNVILAGCSGVGKTYLTNQIMCSGQFAVTEKMFWHGSTEYADVIEGIAASVDQNGRIKYEVLPGMVKQIADDDNRGAKLMIIEGVNKSNAAENFGELITLLEPDKRALKVVGAEGDISIPENMYFLCTMNPATENQYKLDSAMKRRFVIIDLAPDYKLLALHLGIKDYGMPLDLEKLSSFNSFQVKCLAIKVLKSINKALVECIGSNYQIGHAVFWDLKADCTLEDVLKILDLIIIPQIEEYCYDEDVAKRIFGSDSPVIGIYHYGVEIKSFCNLNEVLLQKALKDMITNE